MAPGGPAPEAAARFSPAMSCHHCVVRPATNSRGHPCTRPELAPRPAAAVSVSSFSQVVAGRDDFPRGPGADTAAARPAPSRPAARRPGPPARISRRSGKCAHMAWQDRSRLRRPVTARREEAEKRQCSTPTSTSAQGFLGPAAGTATSRTSPSEHCARASAWLAAGTSPIPHGRTN